LGNTAATHFDIDSMLRFLSQVFTGIYCNYKNVFRLIGPKQRAENENQEVKEKKNGGSRTAWLCQGAHTMNGY
jgi:hypothetical protein